LAHELNNPASAIERCAAMLEDRLEDAEDATRVLAAATLTVPEINAVEEIRAACMGEQKHDVRSPLEQCDREEEILGWLMAHGLNTADAQMLADTEVTFEALNALVAAVDRSHWSAVIRWAAACCAVRNLTSKIQDSATRISSLVTAVKGFTHMDQANVAEPVDLSASLTNTVAVLASKAREKSVTVTLEMETDLPKVRGFAAELSQVWGNLVENALDAVANGGHVNILASRDNKIVLVRILDDGAGVSKEHRDSIFDPFFTTKPFGQGTGLGLDIVRRLVKHNDGLIDFESQPGRTEFRVRLPISDFDQTLVRDH
jgi:signal transduction histidine kinase